MFKLKALSNYLLTYPCEVRFCIVMLCWLPSLLFVLSPQPTSYVILMLAIGVAAWLFKRRGGIVLFCIATLQVAITYTISFKTLLWPENVIIGFIACQSMMFIEALAISMQREALTTAIEARQQLAIAYEQQSKLNALKDELLTSISHELRTPLTEIHGYLDLLLDNYRHLDAVTQLTFINNAMHGCEELLDLTGSMFEALEAGKLKKTRPYERISLVQLMHEVLESFTVQSNSHCVCIDIAADLYAWGDYRYTRYVLYNLLSNAFKYSPYHSHITIKASSSLAEPTQNIHRAHICMSIRDNGQGIPPSELPLLFNRFTRLKRDIMGPVRGSGLGLYICKQLVEDMGGKIWAESNGVRGEGSCFTFTLPSAPPGQ